MLVLRFANSIFEPIWNRNYIDHVQITAAEDVTVGHRAGYYDSVGMLRDMFQNHLLQLMTFTAMEAPARFEADAIRDEKVKVLRPIRAMKPEAVATDTIRGQYRKYRDEPGVPPDSETATFGAVKLHIDNWRWQGVPFLSAQRQGHVVPHHANRHPVPPAAAHDVSRAGRERAFESNRLVIQVQPAEGIQLHFHTKVPDAGMKLRLTDLSFNFRASSPAACPKPTSGCCWTSCTATPACFRGPTKWNWPGASSIRSRRPGRATGKPTLYLYEPGLWGPEESSEWMALQGRQWFDTCPVLVMSIT